GGGDPTLDGLDVAALARAVKAKGIRRVSGRVLGDETIFDPVRYGPQWKRAYYGIESPPLSGLAFERHVDWDTRRVVESPARGARAEEGAGQARRRDRREVRRHRPGPGRGDAPGDALLLAAVADRPLHETAQRQLHRGDAAQGRRRLRRRRRLHAARHRGRAGG